jgi:2-succinyl-5-enolpyruvyl-6-hydroxy-3-cyclohexene-1-carboxylate synthase
MAARRQPHELTIVLLNNDGGGIFNFLPVAGDFDVLEEHVATPHGVDFAHAAALYGLPYRLAGRVDEEPPRGGILELRTDRRENVAVHRRVWEAVRAAG